MRMLKEDNVHVEEEFYQENLYKGDDPDYINDTLKLLEDKNLSII